MYLILPNPCNHGHGIVKCGTGICRPEQITSPIKNYMILPTGAHRIYQRDLTFFAQNFKAWSLNLEQVHYNMGSPLKPVTKLMNPEIGTSPFFFSVVTFSHRRSARIKKLILQKLLKTAKNLGVDTIQDPIGHFGAPWRPLWILKAVQRFSRWASAPIAARLVYHWQTQIISS